MASVDRRVAFGSKPRQDGHDAAGRPGEEAEFGEPPDLIEILDSRLVETQAGAAVVGTIRNAGVDPCTILEVEVTLHDGDTVLGEWVDTTEEGNVTGAESG